MNSKDREKLAKKLLLGASKKAFSGKESFPAQYFRKTGEEAAKRQSKYRNWMPLRTPGDRGVVL